MIICRTPFRVSFFGGGSDYHEWYKNYGGFLISTSIDYYCYVTVKNLPNFFDYKYRILWSKTELIKNLNKIQHPVIRETIRYMKINNGLEIIHYADLPARSGLGSSSSFTVAMLNALSTYKKNNITKKNLSKLAIKIERGILKEKVGIQDQIAASYGGLNTISIKKNGTFDVKKIRMTRENQIVFEKNFLLFYTGIQRFASNIAKKKVNQLNKKKELIEELVSISKESLSYFNNRKDFDEIGRMLHQSWLIKRDIHSSIENDTIREIYNTAINAGALGGKLLGAGGGGFFLFYVNKSKRNQVIKALNKLIYVPLKLEKKGSNIILNSQNYSL